MSAKIKGKLILAIMGMFVIANGCFGRANDTSTKEIKINIDGVVIERTWYGDAFIEVGILSSKDYVFRSPMKITIIPFSNQKNEIELKNIPMKVIQTLPVRVGEKEMKDSVIEMHIHNFPECNRAIVIFHYPNADIAGEGMVFHLEKPTKNNTIEIGSAKWNELMKEKGNFNTSGIELGHWRKES